MDKFGVGFGRVSADLERRVSEFAERHGARFVVSRTDLAPFYFEVDGKTERLPDGESVVLAALRADADLYAELDRHTDIFHGEEIEF
ncbi:hypothetical protein LZC95_49945 [Pendulispora brunnea]|uniref:EthD domain-containing protein n=1 Tax=Pendulispora brunnea TaxID=2905690 RepID=A0ABZ2K764_9BACT